MTDSERPALVQYWHAEDIPDEIAVRIARVAKHNPDMHHMVFNEKSGAAFIESSFTEREAAAFQACAVPAMQADYLRYCAIYALGGVYCDADDYCSESFMPVLEGSGELFHFGRGRARPGGEAASRCKQELPDVIVASSLFGFRASESLLLRLTIDIATAGIESRFCESVPIVTGNAIFSALVMMWRNGVEQFLERMKAWERWYASIPIEREPWFAHLDSIRAIVGDDRRLAQAFDGVRLSPLPRTPGDSALAYRLSGDHFPNWQGSIYR